MFKVTAKSHEFLFKMLSPHRPGQDEIEIHPDLIPQVNMGAMCGNRIMSPNATIGYLDMAAQIVLRKLDRTGRGLKAEDHKHLVAFIARFK